MKYENNCIITTLTLYIYSILYVRIIKGRAPRYKPLPKLSNISLVVLQSSVVCPLIRRNLGDSRI